MKKLKLIIIAVLFVACSGSQNKNKESVIEDDLPQIDLTSLTKKEFIQIDSVTVLPLKMPDNIFMGHVNMLKTDRKGNIYIFDAENANAIYAFDKYGSYVWKLDKRGRGPDEYVEISDFDIYEDMVIIYNRPSKQMLFYSIQDLNYIKTKDVSFDYYAGFRKLSNGWALISEDNSSKDGILRLTTEDMRDVKTSIYDDNDRVVRELSASISFNEQDGTLYYIGSHDGIVYEISDDKFKKKFKINYSLYGIPKEVYQVDDPYELEDILLEKDYLYTPHFMLSHDNFFSFWIFDGVGPESRKLLVGSLDRKSKPFLYKRLKLGEFTLPVPAGIVQNQYASVVQPHDLHADDKLYSYLNAITPIERESMALLIYKVTVNDTITDY